MAYMFEHNSNSNPFWDFLSSLEEHPFFAARFPPGPPPPGGPAGGSHGHPFGPHHAAHGGPSNEAEASTGAAAPTEKQSSDEQPKEQNEKTAEESSAPRTRALGENAAEKDDEGRHHGCHGRRGGHGGSRGRRGGCPAFEGSPDAIPLPFAWGFGPRGRGGPCGGGPGGAHHGHPHHHPGGFGFGGGRGGRGRHGGWRGRGGPHHGGEGFDLSAFLQRIGSRVGIDLSDVARELEIRNNDQIDFIPRADVFDLPSEYMVHVSLPGAQKPDISVDYDAEDNVLRLAGVVYRPQISEELHDALVVSERSRDVGVFERNVKLGTAEKPAHVEVDAITAKLENGILVIRIPKIPEPEKLKKKVSIETVDTSSKGKEKETTTINEKEVLLDLEGDMNVENNHDNVNEKHASVADVPDESDAMHVDSETEHGDEQPPRYHSGQYTPSVDSGDEFEDDTKEYVKVNVD